MVHRTIPKQTGRYPFGSKTRVRPHKHRLLESPTIQQALIQVRGRTPHWDCAKLKQR